ncbi:ROK family protein [Pontibacter sp. JH31]|uniref:ROK family protein n=1 Tax=Pontibacter aquaedesilientis TaxID=2766980 RepID=A0ABR7XFG3_9BACT|nr:ROK family protein [Pontibacter aquaedesilientis]MBD1396661.1 ROK family protein [Pontibacter aquaedesilientis]
MSNSKVLGIDIGATKMHAGVVQNGSILQEVKFHTSAQASQAQIVAELIQGIAPLVDAEVTGIGIGVPGLVDEAKGMVCDVQNIPAWKEVHLKQHLEEHFGIPVYLSNDANSFAAGEKIYGQGKAFRNLVGITLGSGLGAGIIIDHKLYSGTLSSAGELGGVPYLDKTIEDYCSGKFFVAEYGMAGDELYTLAQQGHAPALEAYKVYGQHLGSAIKVVLYLLSPQAIFLGGSISKCYPLFKETMQQSLADFPFKAVASQLHIGVSELDNAAVLGAAALFELKNQQKHQLQSA